MPSISTEDIHNYPPDYYDYEHPPMYTPSYNGPCEDDHLSPYTPNNVQTPEYSLNAVDEASPAVDMLISGRIPSCYLNSCAEICRLTSSTQRHRSKLSQQSWTREAANFIFCYQRSSIAGLRFLPAAITHDIVKVSYHLTEMTIALSRTKYERRKAEAEITDEIIDNLSLNLPIVLEMVVRLGIETCESVAQEIHDGGYYLYLALARLLEAYRSRFAPPGAVYLASQKILLKEHCSGIARLHFNQIHKLKENLLLFDLSPVYHPTNISVAIELLFRTIIPPLKNSGVNRNEDHCLANVLLRLRNIQDELKALLQIKISW